MVVGTAIVYAVSSGHIRFFPFLLILGAPLGTLIRRPPSEPEPPPSLN